MEDIAKNIAKRGLEDKLRKIKKVGEEKAIALAEEHFEDEKLRKIIETVYQNGFVDGISAFIDEIYK